MARLFKPSLPAGSLIEEGVYTGEPEEELHQSNEDAAVVAKGEAAREAVRAHMSKTFQVVPRGSTTVKIPLHQQQQAGDYSTAVMVASAAAIAALALVFYNNNS